MVRRRGPRLTGGSEASELWRADLAPRRIPDMRLIALGAHWAGSL